MPRPTPRCAIALLVWAAACDDTVIAPPRPDSGIATPDGATSDVLALMAGWSFRYRATLTRREGTNEFSSIYEITQAITAVDDRRASGPSSITATATGMNLLLDNWDITKGLDSWVARIGPSELGDAVSPLPATIELSGPPDVPPRPGAGRPKTLPQGEIFFIDTRRIGELRIAFSETHAAIGAMTFPPDEADGRWRFSLDGMDRDMLTYPMAVQQRRMDIEYDPRGFLTSISERLGDFDDMTQPTGAFSLSLVSTPPP